MVAMAVIVTLNERYQRKTTRTIESEKKDPFSVPLYFNPTRNVSNTIAIRASEERKRKKIKTAYSHPQP